MPSLAEIYNQHADDYEALVACEDYEGHLLERISRLVQLYDATVVDTGAGTGRISRLLHTHVESIKAFDASSHMIDHARYLFEDREPTNCTFDVAPHHDLPIVSGTADFLVSGWAMCYAYLWANDAPDAHLRAALREAERVVRSGGCIILLETMGTGCYAPCPPADLAPYFEALHRHGFESDWFRTDYRFPSRERAEYLIRFFFGEAMLPHLDVTPDGKAYLPECTGIWWKYI